MSNQNTTNIDTMSPFDFVLFGGTGDLAMRKLLPSMYYHHCDELLAEQGRIIAVARTQLSREEYLNKAEEAARKHVDAGCFTDDKWQKFAERVHYIAIDAGNAKSYKPLGRFAWQR